MADQLSKERIYTILEKSFLLQGGRSMWVGSEFKDHGRAMRIVAVGKVHKEGRERLIDLTAVEISE